MIRLVQLLVEEQPMAAETWERVRKTVITITIAKEGSSAFGREMIVAMTIVETEVRNPMSVLSIMEDSPTETLTPSLKFPSLG